MGAVGDILRSFHLPVKESTASESGPSLLFPKISSSSQHPRTCSPREPAFSFADFASQKFQHPMWIFAS
jgi:hypothetical protein